IPQGSVRVSAGRQLEENVDYEIDYSTGRLRILNDAILSSGVPINVAFEDNTVFGLQNKTMLGLRADYELSDDLNIGGTFMQLFERPFTPKVNAGDDPINNRIYGLDFTLNKEAPWLTRAVDKLPFYSTTEPSSISVLAETAIIDPGHARAINQSRKDKRGIVYVDDFEGSASTIDLRQPTNQWFLASVPQNSPELFPEARLDGLVSGANRARLNWYVIDPLARQSTAGDDRNPYTSLVPQTEVFPNRNIQPNQRADILVFDLSYYPNERGPYNFDVPNGIPGITAGVNVVNDTLAPVQLKEPESRWGGIMRAMNTNDFQSANIEFIEFWMLSPFLSENSARQPAADVDQKQGTLYINLGNISEDILKDSRRFFENGLPGPANPNRPTVNTSWGRVPVGQQITRAFDNDPETRRLQDVGLDGLSDREEALFFDDYLNQIEANNPNAASIVRRDPATDNFQFYDQGFANTQGVKVRYRRFNNPQGNSGANNDNRLRQSGTNIPDAEDLDRDNTLNETESYFEYKIPFFYDPTNPREIDLERTPYITDRREAQNGRIWYRFRVPLRDGQSKGGIQDFRSIRFMRMYLRDFEAPTTLRFASFDLVRSQWRRYTQSGLSEDFGDQTLCGEDNFQIDAVNIEENSSKQPFNYTLPQGVIREQTLGVFQALQNEQSLALRIDNLCDGDAKAVFKYTEMDMRLYENLEMFVHAESRGPDPLPDDALSLFIRLGSDFKNNYYEYEIPLKVSRTERLPTGGMGENVNNATEAYKREVWLPENLINFPLAALRELKTLRNSQGGDIGIEFVDENFQPDPKDRPNAVHTIKVKGNPNLGFVKVMMIGVRNPKARDDNDLTQGIPYSVEVWANELRLLGLDERTGVAGIARIDMQMADLGAVTLAGNYNSIGFGALDAGVLDRSREQITGYDLAFDLNVDKFFPEEWGLRIPFYAQRSNTTSTPEYDPYDLDIRLKDKLNDAAPDTRDSLREQAREIVNITTYNFNNVRKERTGGGSDKPKPWDVENFSVSYGYTRTERSDPLISRDTREEYTGGLNYGFSRPTKYLEPFKGIKSKPLRLIKEFNVNPLPNSFNFSTILDRQFSTTSYRFAGVEERFNTFFNKRFNWNRNYDFNWDITRSLKFNFNATAIAAIDEPDEIAILEDPNIADRDQFRRDSIWTNIRNLGRPKNYEHGLNVSYTLPIRYLPYMEWVQVRAQYQGGYTWTAASLNVDSLGNVIQNRQQRQLSADLNFDRLYDQFAFLKQYNRPLRRSRGRNSRNARGRNKQEEDEELPANRRASSSRNQGGVNPAARAIVRPLLMLRKARFSYSEQFQTVVPGFMPQTELLGLSSGFDAPGWGFVAGLQPKIRELDENWYGQDDWLFQNREWITSNVFMNRDVIQDYSQNFEARLTIEPFDDFRVEIEANRTFTENYTESFKVFDKEVGTAPLYEHRVPTYGGQLQVSYNAMPTLFQSSKEEIIALFNRMQSYRPIISQRLGTGLHRDPELAAQGYTDGYGRNHQDVLLPAFVAAYTGQDPNTIDLDLFNTPFKPNWRVNYSGLSRLRGFQDIFASFNISHGYRSTFVINNYGTGLDYLATRDAEIDPGLDTVSFNLFPRIEIPDLVISDNFAPLLAIEAQLQNGMSFNMDYQQSRNLAMNVTSKLLSETRAQEITIGFGYVMQGVNIGFLTGKKNGRSRRSDAETPNAPGSNPAGRGR
ncbi:MAG: cell surface protein SprA, partial [Bacteroidetes bacterium]